MDANGGSFILTYYGLINGASTNETQKPTVQPDDKTENNNAIVLEIISFAASIIFTILLIASIIIR